MSRRDDLLIKLLLVNRTMFYCASTSITLRLSTVCL